MSNMGYIGIILLFIILLLILIMVYYSMNEKLKLEKIKLYDSIDFDAKENLLDRIVLDTFNNYKISNPELSEDGSYINQDKIVEMVKVITAKTFIKITPAIKTNISLIYNIGKDDNTLINIIGEKIGLLVMDFAAQINSTLE